MSRIKCYISQYCVSLMLQKKIQCIFCTATNMPVLYVDEASPPARFVMMTASLLNVELDIKKIDLFAGEHKTLAYSKINPLQKVPALEIGDNVIVDSHAAAIYLCQHVSNQDLYPKENILMTKVNEMLFFNCSTLFKLDSEILSSYFAGKWPVAQSKIEEWYHALDYLERKLNKNNWLTSEKMNLCDLCMMSTVTSVLQLLPLLDRHIRIKSWLNELEKLECTAINRRGLARLKHYLDLYKPNN